MMTLRAVFGAVLFSLAVPPTMVAAESVPVARFEGEEGPLPSGWEPLHFRSVDRATRYELETRDGRRVLRAEADRSASGLVRRVEVDLRKTPVLEWEWKVERVLDAGDIRRKEGDDTPARVYVTFETEWKDLGFLERTAFRAAKLLYGEAPPTSAINYVWASRAPVGRILPNAYSERARMIVVESGPAHAGEWRRGSRNVLEDYRAAFGKEPPRVTGVAVMTDADDTGETVTAWYGDITFRAGPEPAAGP